MEAIRDTARGLLDQHFSNKLSPIQLDDLERGIKVTLALQKKSQKIRFLENIIVCPPQNTGIVRPSRRRSRDPLVLEEPEVLAHLREQGGLDRQQPLFGTADGSSDRRRDPRGRCRFHDARRDEPGAVEASRGQEDVAHGPRDRGEAGRDDRQLQVRPLQEAGVRVPGAAGLALALFRKKYRQKQAYML